MGFIDLTGKVFGKLEVIKLDKIRTKATGRTYWICKCSCGNKDDLSIRGDALGKRTWSCGCYHKEQAAKYCKENYTKTNKYDLSGEYGIGWTSKNEEFWFDLEDYDKIKGYCWSIADSGYLQARDNNSIILIHRLIFMNQYPDGNFTVDHIGHNVLDNRKSKLRVAEQRHNCRNKIKMNKNTSGVTGVSWDNAKQRWLAQIGINHKNIYLGRYVNFEDAVKARKEAEEKYFGEWSYDNSMKIYNNLNTPNDNIAKTPVTQM